jgi:hypothetical protein
VDCGPINLNGTIRCFFQHTEPDSRKVKNQNITEKIKAVTTEQLAKKTKEVYNRHITSKKVLETYLEPLLNEGYIDKTGSDIDHRSNIYYPLIDAPKPFDYSINDQSNNILHKPRIIVRDIAVYPFKLDIISKVEEVFRYSTEKEFQTIVKNNDWRDMTAKELVDQYYNNVENYFEYVHEHGNTCLLTAAMTILLQENICFVTRRKSNIFKKTKSLANHKEKLPMI